MAIDKVKLPDSSTQDIHDSRIQGIDSTPTANSVNLVTSGGVKSALSGYLPLTGGTITGTTTLTYGTNLDFVDSNEKNHSLRAFASWPDSLAHYAPGNGWVRMWDSGNDGSGSGLDADLLDGWQGERYVLYNGDTLGNNVDFNEITYKRGNSIVIQPIHVNNYSGQTNVPFTGYGQMLTFGGQETLFPFRIAHSSTHSKLFYNSAGYKTTNEFNFSGGSGWKEIAFTDSNVASATSATYADGLRDYEHHDYDTRRTSGNFTYADAALHYYLATGYMTDAGRPGADGYIMHLGWDNARFDSQLWIATNDTAASQGGAHMKVRHHNNGADDSSWGNWHSVAMTDSNVASASKLLTPRSIWGQSFDGTANVSGLLTSVTGINMTGNLMLDIGSSGIYLNGTGVSIHNASNAWSADALKFDASGNARFYHFLNVGSAFSGDSSRAILSVIAPSDHPCDLVLGASGVNKWSITTRQSTKNYSLGFYSYVTGNWPLWMSHDGNVRIGGPGSDGTDKLQVEGTIKGESMTTYLQTSQPSGGMLPNREYKLGTLSSATTFTLAAETSGVTNHYFWTFETGSTAPTITWPAAITSWAGGSAPSINSNRHYEVSVLNGVAVVLEV